ncbi:glutaredoxin-1 [Kryptolebias marmoratus]|uniref:Glutaredoxin (thioltransferase) n=1 Tax=Kryptolebias marmoratus TaxID=37003 RepID=A0A3Q3GR67_KRYMA|nr:glutaredoxin-1 [Kryptolebias marmoratus]XP_017278354.1 glutaredoxin-1 [Kryptolebias marmoratus]
MAQQFVKAHVKGDRVVVFLKPGCRFCSMAEEALSEYAFKPGRFKCVDISARDDMDSIQDYFRDTTGARTVPRVFIGERCIGGGSEVRALHQSGQLEELLRSIEALQ